MSTTLDEMEKAIFVAALKKHGGRRGLAAKDLNIGQSTVYRWIRSLNGDGVTIPSGPRAGRPRIRLVAPPPAARVTASIKECSVPGCGGDPKASGAARGYCLRHYAEMRRYGRIDLMRPRRAARIKARRATIPCSWAGCEMKITPALLKRKGIRACAVHEEKVAMGITAPGAFKLTADAWVSRHTKENGSCLEWTSSPSQSSPFGTIPGTGKSQNLSAWFWERAGNAPIKGRLQRLCKNSRCVNANHMRPARG